ncbi:MAG: hypothetical protein JWP63_141 [Candidatus Solibacter sp.]|nr:hypothetical protein [Candidatus Solibacter sp.]
MALEILRYTADRIAAVRAFNARLDAQGVVPEQRFPETPDPGWFPRMELYLAVEDGTVRGGYILRRQCFQAAGEIVEAAHYRLPLSEGLIDRKYSGLGLRFVRDALAREPRLYAMGMGGWENALPQMLKRLKWQMSAVPFYFKVLHPARFLRNIRAVRTSAYRRLAMDVAAITGTGWIGMKALGMARALPLEKVDLGAGFGPWADEVWDRARGGYGLTAVRDAATLEEIYPAVSARFLRVRAAGGWAIVLDTQLKDHKQFGGMRLGTIVDGFAPIESVPAVVRAATSLLEQRGVDLIVSNQSHAAWGRGLREAGFREGPSNYLSALSPELAKLAGNEDGNFHFTRGDADGPMGL